MEIGVNLNSGIYEITMRGQFTFSDHLQFKDILERISQEDIEQVIFQMRGVEFIDSAGLGMLLLAQETSENLHKQLSIVGACGQVKKMFKVAHFENIFALREA